MSEETTKQTAGNEEFFRNFMNEKEEKQNVGIAKQQDVIKTLEAKISKFQTAQTNEQNAKQACQMFIKNNSYPALNPIVSLLSGQLDKSIKSKKQKIKKANKKIQKAKRKIKKLKRKQKRGNLLSVFMSSLKNANDNKQEIYLSGMGALREDSIIRAEKKLDKANEKLEKLKEKLKVDNLSETGKVKINAKIKKLESETDILTKKISNLNALEQDLNRLAKIELGKDKVDELADTAVKTVEKATLEGSSISETIDSITEISHISIDDILKPLENEEVTAQLNAQIDNDVIAYNDITQETAQAINNAGYSLAKGHLEYMIPDSLTGKSMTAEQAEKIVNSGIAIQGGKKKSDNEYMIYVHKSDEAKVDKILTEPNTQTQKPKR